MLGLPRQSSGQDSALSLQKLRSIPGPENQDPTSCAATPGPHQPKKKTRYLNKCSKKATFIHCSNFQKTSKLRLLFNTVLEVLAQGVSRHSKKTKIKLSLFRVCMTVYAENPKEHTKKITKISEYNHQFYLYILAITHQKRS